MIVFRSRSGHWVLLTTLAMCVLAAATGRRAFELDFVSPPTKLVLVDLCVIVTATLLAILTRPRFWEWERIAPGVRPHVVAGVVAAVTIGLSVLCVPAVVPWLPAGASWGWVLANALVLSATVHLLAALISPLLAGAVTLALWLAVGVTANLAPQVWLPLAYYRAPNNNWSVAAALVVLAVTIHAVTCGVALRLAQRRVS